MFSASRAATRRPKIAIPARSGASGRRRPSAALRLPPTRLDTASTTAWGHEIDAKKKKMTPLAALETPAPTVL